MLWCGIYINTYKCCTYFQTGDLINIIFKYWAALFLVLSALWSILRLQVATFSTRHMRTVKLFSSTIQIITRAKLYSLRHRLFEECYLTQVFSITNLPPAIRLRNSILQFDRVNPLVDFGVWFKGFWQTCFFMLFLEGVNFFHRTIACRHVP